jgi:hypothetical protein
MAVDGMEIPTFVGWLSSQSWELKKGGSAADKLLKITKALNVAVGAIRYSFQTCHASEGRPNED